MPVIRKPVKDANGMVTSLATYTTTNNTAAGWGGRRKKPGMASTQYPYVHAFTTTETEPV